MKIPTFPSLFPYYAEQSRQVFQEEINFLHGRLREEEGGREGAIQTGLAFFPQSTFHPQLFIIMYLYTLAYMAQKTPFRAKEVCTVPTYGNYLSKISHLVSETIISIPSRIPKIVVMHTAQYVPWDG